MSLIAGRKRRLTKNVLGDLGQLLVTVGITDDIFDWMRLVATIMSTQADGWIADTEASIGTSVQDLIFLSILRVISHSCLVNCIRFRLLGLDALQIRFQFLGLDAVEIIHSSLTIC